MPLSAGSDGVRQLERKTKPNQPNTNKQTKKPSKKTNKAKQNEKRKENPQNLLRGGSLENWKPFSKTATGRIFLFLP